MKSHNEPPTSRTPPLTILAITPSDWPVIETLFGSNGACGGCWCMWWRVERGGKLWEESKGEKNCASLRSLVEAGAVHAVIAYSGTQPVGWCSFGPRETFPRLETVRALKTDWNAGTWSIVCFFIRAGWRGRGVGTALLKAATARALELGAREIESYPVVPKKERMPSAFAWTGVPAMFEACGYECVSAPDAPRPIMTKKPARRRQ
jgi:GNAT superfamily N-acetyltransferase